VGIGVETPFPTLVEGVVGGKVLVGVEELCTTTGLAVVEVASVEDTTNVNGSNTTRAVTRPTFLTKINTL
jgi:hypothetical protein